MINLGLLKSLCRARLLWVCLLSCEAAGCGGSQRPACSDTTLAAITAECTAAVVRACQEEGSDYDSCKAREPIEAACDKRIDEWEACR